MAAVLLAAGSGGGVTDLRTTLAMTSVEAKGAFAAAGDLAPGFKSAGGAQSAAGRRDASKWSPVLKVPGAKLSRPFGMPMPSIDSVSLNDLLSAPLQLGALAALLAVLAVLAFRRSGVARRLLVPIAVLVIVGLGLTAVLDRLAQNERAAERRALTERAAHLTAQALAPGSALACLDGAAGEAVENACEKAVFAGPQSDGRGGRLYGGAADAAG